MFKQLCKHHQSWQPIFAPKTYNHASLGKSKNCKEKVSMAKLDLL